MTEPKEPKLPGYEDLNESEKNLIDNNFAVCVLDQDVANSFNKISFAGHMGNFDRIKPVQTYEEYLGEVSTSRSNPEAYYNAVMEKSDKAMVEEYNRRIRAFNDGLEEIKRARDAEKINNFMRESLEFLRTRR